MTNTLTFAYFLELNEVFPKQIKTKKEKRVIDQSNHTRSKKIPVQVTHGRSILSSKSLIKQ